MPKADARLVAGTPFEVVDLRPGDGSLKRQLVAAVAAASSEHLRPYVELTSAWCAACHWLDHSLAKSPVAQAFGGTYLVRIDVDRWEGLMSGTGLDDHDGPLPAFVALSQRARPVGDWIDRADWDSDVPAQAAPVLAVFFHWP